MKFVPVLLITAAIAGCMETALGVDPMAPQVSEFNGNAVKIIHHRFAVGNSPASPIVIKANEICGTQGKRAIFGSFMPINQYEGEHTYLCL